MNAQHKPTAAKGQSHSYPQCKTACRVQPGAAAPSQIQQSFSPLPTDAIGSGGADRDRTGDLLLAKQALSQLSYGPKASCPQEHKGQSSVVGQGRLELPTSRLSSARS